ncbi:hypothetical protein ASPWEDRAFT_340074 [Aspergillus wentii DTO 134E9]|uniref:Uncharacterized protein n=1 Tax=Aspergillus wentii DTO 134E9 TaxID=1073089 RepID=A0A1L9RUT9_ASPWE|nr:uncharacterized protein ASPWEDRAFT_340074 [Aspergillus wentii DTO 134E9]OJJ38686.1 hypothetical protein ASPWEDRAFT_340074 [Aspergillus wentii DTO 134E9]
MKSMFLTYDYMLTLLTITLLYISLYQYLIRRRQFLISGCDVVGPSQSSFVNLNSSMAGEMLANGRWHI